MSEVDVSSPAGGHDDQQQQHSSPDEKNSATGPMTTSSEGSESPGTVEGNDKGSTRMAQDEGSSIQDSTEAEGMYDETKRSLETISTPSSPSSKPKQPPSPSSPKKDKTKVTTTLPGRPPLSPKVKLRKEQSNNGTSNKKSVIPYVHDPSKVTLKFLFANKDGLSVELQFKPSDTVGEVKGSLLSMWPDALPKSSGGDGVRLICMGKGILMPDSRSLKECEVPVFETHATPINVSVRPPNVGGSSSKKGDSDDKKKYSSGNITSSSGTSGVGGSHGNNRSTSGNASSNSAVEQGCSCVIL